MLVHVWTDGQWGGSRTHLADEHGVLREVLLHQRQRVVKGHPIAFQHLLG